MQSNQLDAWLARTSFYQEVVGVAVALRWLLILGGTLWLYLHEESDVATAWMLGGAAVYNAVLTALWRLGRHPPLALTSLVDLAAILTLLILFGPQSHPIYLFGLLALVLTLAYGWPGVALALGGYLIGEGALLVTEPSTSPDLAALLLRAGSLAIAASALGAFVVRFETLRGHLADATISDRVTGLYNRHYFLDALEHIHRLAIRGQRAYSVLMIDTKELDAAIKDKGPLAGDRLLRMMWAEARAAVRSTDLVGRVGKDEFAVALPETGMPAAEIVARKLHDRLRQVSGGLGVAVGVADLQPTWQNASDDGLRAAYAVLTQAKAESGDRVVTTTAAAG